MAAFTFTAASVINAGRSKGVAGESLTAGDLVYRDSGDDYKLKKCDNVTSAKAACVGMVMHAALTGQPASYDSAGTITVGTDFVAGDVGKILVISTTAGKCEPWADLATSDYITNVGYVASTTTFVMKIQQTGLQKP